MVSLTPEEQREFMWLKPKMFTPCAGAWGRQGATNVILAEADKPTLRAAMNLAWERILAKPPARKRAATKVPKLAKVPKAAKPAAVANPAKAARPRAAPAKIAKAAKASRGAPAEAAKTATAASARRLKSVKKK
jgi:hypothetical protein